MKNIQVPLYVIIGYAAFVVAASLLVGLLPPFVNRPPCKNETNSKQTQDLVKIRTDLNSTLNLNLISKANQPRFVCLPALDD